MNCKCPSKYDGRKAAGKRYTVAHVPTCPDSFIAEPKPTTLCQCGEKAEFSVHRSQLDYNRYSDGEVAEPVRVYRCGKCVPEKSLRISPFAFVSLSYTWSREAFPA